MKYLHCIFLLFLFILGIAPGCLSASVEYDDQIPQVAFAAKELGRAQKEAGRDDLKVVLVVRPEESPESFQIRTLGPNEANDDLFVWSASNNEALKSMKTGIYHLEAEALDKNGLLTTTEINITVGNASVDNKDDWKDEIHEVILSEGEKFWDGDIREFPKLNCFVSLANDGSLALKNGTPKNTEGGIWANNGKGNCPKWKIKPEPTIYRFYTFVENGQMKILREKDGRPTVLIYKTPPAKASGLYKLGITASKSLIVFRENGENTKIVWRSHR